MYPLEIPDALNDISTLLWNYFFLKSAKTQILTLWVFDFDSLKSNEIQ